MIKSVPLPIVVLLAGIISIEGLLALSDAGLVGGLRWRAQAYQNGAFWPGLLHNWQPNYTVQPVTMFASYSFLHADLNHMIGNALTIFLIGPRVYDHFGRTDFGWIWIGSVLGGALCFAALHTGPQPMIGASGFVFGLAGALTAMQWSQSGTTRKKWGRMIAIVLGLIALNIVVYVATGGLLAWETHLGGFVAGFVIAMAMRKGCKSL